MANKRACTIEVDGKASVSWFAGYRPAGRTGELVGVVGAAESLRPVIRVERTSANGRSVFDHILQRYETTLPEIVDEECGHIARGHRLYDSCEQEVLLSATSAIEVTDTPFTRCAVEVQERSCQMLYDDERGHSCGGGGGSLAGAVMSAWWHHSRLSTAVHQDQANPSLRDCIVQANEQLSEHGLEFDIETTRMRLLD